jgi:heme o synthase
MIRADNVTNEVSNQWRTRLFAAVELLKLRLSALVAFSGAVGYLLGSNLHHNYALLILFVVSGLLITGAANGTNQILEVEWDRLMKRTDKRPIPSGRLSKTEASWIVFVLLFIGLTIQAVFFTPLAAVLSFASFVLYGFVYTPLKRVGPIAVFVGAIPGALPVLIGWTAATGTIGWGGSCLFVQQAIWQFPHFWAIAWVLDYDYKRAGFRLLPLNKIKSLQNSLIVFGFTMLLIPLGFLPYWFNVSGMLSALVATCMGLFFLYLNWLLVKKQTDKAARRLMLGSFIYLPVVQLAYLLDRL